MEIKDRMLLEIIGSSWVKNIRTKVERNMPRLISAVKITTREKAIELGVEKVQAAFAELSPLVDFTKSDHGHAIGHFTRDYVNGLRLIHGDFGDSIDHVNLYLGFIAGCLHDVGCGIVHRYQEGKYFVRHAEAAAILIERCACLTTVEKLLIQYAVMAHTHYLRESLLLCIDGVERVVKPYQDVNANGDPLYFIWLPRWFDRLDMNGPLFPCRHFITLIDAHGDFDGKDFHVQDLNKVMLPQLKQDCGIHTMVQHMSMYAGTQSNDSPYGKFDFGAMTLMRDSYRAQLEKVIKVVLSPAVAIPGEHEAAVLDEFSSFLKRNVEPTENGARVVDELMSRFQRLPDYRLQWLAGFKESMSQFNEWRVPIIKFLDSIPKEYHTLPGITNDVREIYKK